MTLDLRTPVIVGVGQLTLHTDTGEASLEPVDMMVEALRRAEADTGAAGVLAAAGSLGVVRLLSWKYPDAAALVAERLGIGPLQTVGTAFGGNIPQTLLGRKAAEIAAGEHDVVLITGAEAWRTVTAARRGGGELDWTVQPEGITPDAEVGGSLEASHPAETARGIRHPIQIYPLFENALRAAAGRSVAEHRDHLGSFYARFSEIAVDNPYAWDRRGYSPEEVAVPSAKNRMVGFPYTKLMCSNEQVDQAAAMILCSVDKARALGIAPERWVFPHGVTEAAAPLVSERYDLSGSVMADAASDALWKLTGLGPDDIAHVDLYSCFPSAVQVQAGARRARSRPSAHRDRRYALRRRSVEQLRHARDGGDGRRPAGRPRRARIVRGEWRLPQQAVARRLLDDAARRVPRRLRAGRRRRDAQARGRRHTRRPRDRRELHGDARPHRRTD